MESISLKLDRKLLQRMEAVMETHHYSTKTEFVREAIRDKMQKLDKGEILRRIDAIAGTSKHRTTDEDLHRVREELAKKHLQDPQ